MGHWRIMNIEQGISNYEPDIKTSLFRIRLSRISCPLSSAGISSPLGNYVTIRRTRHSGRREATVRNPEKRRLLDPGSRPPPADLAGMTIVYCLLQSKSKQKSSATDNRPRTTDIPFVFFVIPRYLLTFNLSS